ncbi:MAG: histidine phosphatase family protein [Candidatus Limivicinus sp.]|nr:histidine phosphatase family protein [Candidatus Limivicinus sp.]
MRRIYLARHGRPDFPGGEKYCLGSTDMPLSPFGRLQACLLGRELRGMVSAVFTSPLSRAADTARFIAPEPVVITGLAEASMGDWDGLSFREIKLRWPELYAARGRDANIPMPDSESFEHAQRRFAAAVGEALGQSGGDIAIVAHNAVMQSFLCLISGSDEYRAAEYRSAYGGYYIIEYDGKGFAPQFPAIVPQFEPDDALCAALMEAVPLPERVREHCRAVCREADRIASELTAAGRELDAVLIHRAALLHDIARTQPEHPAAGAAWLRGLGSPELADIVRQHHDLDAPAEVNEAAVVYIADKCVGDAERIPLERRFEKSFAKCKDDKAREAHRRRAAEALGLKEIINTYCRKEIIQ